MGSASPKALEYALRLSPDVTALHVVALEGPDGNDQEAKLRAEWHELVERPVMRTGLTAPRLSLISSEFRSITAPLLRALEDARTHHPGRPVTVILPELVEGRWWGHGWRLSGIEPHDLLGALAGVAHVRPGEKWKRSAVRMVDLLMKGMQSASSSAKRRLG